MKHKVLSSEPENKGSPHTTAVRAGTRVAKSITISQGHGAVANETKREMEIESLQQEYGDVLSSWAGKPSHMPHFFRQNSADKDKHTTGGVVRCMEADTVSSCG